MSGKSWVLKGIDPAQRQKVRDEAARAGLSVAEYLSQALQRSVDRAADAEAEPYIAPIGADRPSTLHRLDGLERRMEAAIAGLDEALQSVDRSLFSLADRFDETENLSHDTAQAVANALSEFSEGLDAMRAELGAAAADTQSLRELTESAKAGQDEAHGQLAQRIERAHEIAVSAENAAAILKLQQESLTKKFDSDFAEFAHATQDNIEHAFAAAREAAETAAESAEDALAEALETLRAQRDALEQRLAASESETALRVETMRLETGARTQALEERMSETAARVETGERRFDIAQRDIKAAIAGIKSAAASALHIQSETIKAEQARVNQDLARFHEAAEEAESEIRDALDELREHQRGQEAELRLIDDALGGADALLDTPEGEVFAPVSVRLTQLEADADAKSRALGQHEAALRWLETELKDMAERPIANLHESVLARFDGLTARLRLQEQEQAQTTAKAESLEQSIARLNAEIANVAARADNSIQTIESSIADLLRRSSATAVLADVESLAQRLEDRMQQLERSTVSLLQEERAGFAKWIDETRTGFESGALNETVADMGQRLGGLEQRQAELSQSLSAEVGRMAALLDQRLSTVERFCETVSETSVSREELAQLIGTLQSRAGEGVSRDELARAIAAFDSRLDDSERREQANAQRLTENISGMRQNLDERFANMERRSVLAVEKIAESVAQMGKRLTQRQEEFVLDLVERVESADPRLAHKLTQKR